MDFKTWVVSSFFLFLAPGPVVHEFYISICYIKQVEDHLVVDYRVFRDDVEIALKTTLSSTSKENFCQNISSYIQDHFEILLDGKLVRLRSEDCKYEGTGQLETVSCRLVSDPYPASASNMKISSSVLLDAFDDQVNMIHVQLGALKKSMNLDRDRLEFSLNLL